MGKIYQAQLVIAGWNLHQQRLSMLTLEVLLFSAWDQPELQQIPRPIEKAGSLHN